MEKEGAWLGRELKRRRKLTREVIGGFAEAMEMKKGEVAELMGVEL